VNPTSLRAGLREAQEVVTSALEALIRGQSGQSVLGIKHAPTSQEALLARPAAQPKPVAMEGLTSARRLQQAATQDGVSEPNPVDRPIDLEICDWLNITACNTTGALLIPCSCAAYLLIID
jgi:hypothetical protein